jgi:transposase
VESERHIERSCANVTTIGAERPDTKAEVILGVDTHLDFHVAVAVDHLGRRLGESSVPTTANGYERLLCWTEGFGPLRCAGVEGTSSYGAGLVRHLKARGTEVLEVERPKRPRRSSRRNAKKSDPADAELDAQLARLVAQVAPELVCLAGIGTENAATLLIVALKTIPRG